MIVDADCVSSQQAAMHVERATRGFPGLVVRLLNCESLALWAPRISASYYDFGDIKTTAITESKVRVLRTGIPHWFVRSFTSLSREFGERLLVAGGAKRAHFFVYPPEPDGERAGQALWRVTTDCTWVS